MRPSLLRLTAAAAVLSALLGGSSARSAPTPAGMEKAPASQSPADVQKKSQGCVSCHKGSDQASMHKNPQPIGCADCHGGNAGVVGDGAPGSAGYDRAKREAHVHPKNGDLWKTAANPERSYADALKEDLAFIRFVNPGDLRAARFACGSCHDTDQDPIVHHVSRNPMTTGAMLYGAALYNNGVLPGKGSIVGESYAPDGTPQKLLQMPAPTPEEQRDKGVLPALVPFPRWELGQTGNPFRVFERGGRRRLEVGLPDVFEEPGKPDKGLSPRGPGTLNRIDPVILGAQKTRLLDPMLSMLGTNDHPGDFRSSGCSACHVVYANDRSTQNSGPYAAFGNRGQSRSEDPTIDKKASGHPLKHEFTRAIPSSQCMTCHMHPGTNMVSTYLGYTWWDNEVDGEHLYPKQPKQLSDAETDKIQRRNPEGAALKGLWSDPDFLANIWTEVNPKAKRTQFGDFHGHGWVFRKVFKQDRKGRLLDAKDAVIADDDPKKFDRAVHLMDIHLEKGMHCVDCHFKQDNHGDGKLYGEPRAAIEIDCVDCHGTVDKPAAIFDGRPSGPASKDTSGALGDLKTPFQRQARFEEVQRGARTVLVQRSMVNPELTWEVPQVKDTVTPGNPRYSEKARLAKTIQKGGRAWGSATAKNLAHDNSNMTCYSCHSSWTTSCFGCHLSMKANEKKPNLHNEGGDSRNWTSYNFQTLRDDIYFLARNGAITHKDGEKTISNRIAPARSACAVIVSSQNQNREWIYQQKQTVSSAGFSGTSFSTYVPHTVRGKETKTCSDCHASAAGDNNAWLAQLFMQGTGFTNFIGRYAYVGEEHHGFEAVAVTERDEPQAVIGSALHALAYPAEFKLHGDGGRALREAYHHGGEVVALQAWGEYLFAAQGKGGLRVYDVAQVDNKGFSERLVSSPVSPLGQRLYVKTNDAAAVALPSTQTIDPSRTPAPGDLEQKVHPVYSYAYVADREEGLVVAGPLHTLLDGDPTNNFLKRAATFDGGGVLKGASSITLAGSLAYLTTPRGVVVVGLDDPLKPTVLAEVGAPLKAPRAVAVQFRYAFVLDEEGLKVLDVTTPASPRVVPGAAVAIPHAHRLALARTYAYVAAGATGLAIVDLESPEKPRLDQTWNANGAITDAHDVQIGMTNGSAFAYVADGKNGLRVVQIVSANSTPGAYGFSPRPTPELVATYKTHGPAVALSRGVDRDRAVDETGNQTSVFGRRGARPLTLTEQQRMYLRDGKLFTVDDKAPGPASR